MMTVSSKFYLEISSQGAYTLDKNFENMAPQIQCYIFLTLLMLIRDYARARMYDADNRRFMAIDPIKDGLNHYLYTNNNPILYIDPSGLVRERAGDRVGTPKPATPPNPTPTVIIPNHERAAVGTPALTTESVKPVVPVAIPPAQPVRQPTSDTGERVASRMANDYNSSLVCETVRSLAIQNIEWQRANEEKAMAARIESAMFLAEMMGMNPNDPGYVDFLIRQVQIMQHADEMVMGLMGGGVRGVTSKIKNVAGVGQSTSVSQSVTNAVQANAVKTTTNKTIQTAIKGGQVSGKDMVKALEKEGFVVQRQAGSHVTLKGPNGESVQVPVHGNQDLAKGTLNSVLKQAGYK